MSEDWDGTCRRDGLLVSRSVADVWVIIPFDGRASISTCPCCDQPLFSAAAARFVADEVYPLAGNADPA
jgi:hypothetical protein